MVRPSSDEFELIQDPEVGLTLLSKLPLGGETPDQERERQFWQLQFQAMADWQAGDVLAVGRALVDCSLFNRPPPFWLLIASNELCLRHMSGAEKRTHSDINRHFLCWKAVKLVRGQHPNDPRNYKKKVHGDAVWEEAAKLMAGPGVKPSLEPDTVRKSYALIEHAGGARVTLPSYKREVKERDRRRQKRRKKVG